MNDKKPYLIDAITGNSRFLVSMGRTGRVYRIWWPHIDYPQHLDNMRSGLRLLDAGGLERTTWFDGEEDGWTHQAGFLPKTNIFQVTAVSAQCPVTATSTDFAVPGEDFIVREYRFANNGNASVSFDFILYSCFTIMENGLYNTTEFEETHDALVHFRHRYFFSVSGANVCTHYQAGAGVWNHASRGTLTGNVIDMKPDGALSWRFEGVASGDTVSMAVYIAAGTDRPGSLASLANAKSRTSEQWMADTAEYWRRYLDAAVPCPSGDPDIAELYERSLLMFKLMADEQTGSLIAAPEFDETFSRSGGYGFCWGRDAAFITTALDKCGLTDLASKFYDWTLAAQDADGSWRQRHYHDGSLAPSWGLQIDEGGSILWGMWQHYKHTGDRAFAERVWPAVESGAQYLLGYLDEQNGLPRPSRDLWEERQAQHTYSSAAVYGGLNAAVSFAELLGRQAPAASWRQVAERIVRSIEDQCWNADKGSFYRGLNLSVTKEAYDKAIAAGVAGRETIMPKGYARHTLDYDPVIDVSLLGLVVPFGVLPVNHEYVWATADAIERALTVPDTGGILRYEDDRYIGGNPWILTTLWLAQYRIQNGQYDSAKSLLHWAVEHQTCTGLLPEQVDRQTGETAWVVPLTWSHAMFVLTVWMLAESDELQSR